MILLLGLRGAGKSTIGAAVAARLGRPFADLDDLVRRAADAVSIGELVERAGMPAFRHVETAMLRTALLDPALLPGGILALGGGTPTAPGAEALLRDALARGARLVYLRVTPAVQRARLRAGPGPDRPSLTGADPLSELDAIFAARDAAYRALASHVVDAEGPAETVADSIVDLA